MWLYSEKKCNTPGMTENMQCDHMFKMNHGFSHVNVALCNELPPLPIMWWYKQINGVQVWKWTQPKIFTGGDFSHLHLCANVMATSTMILVCPSFIQAVGSLILVLGGQNACCFLCKFYVLFFIATLYVWANCLTPHLVHALSAHKSCSIRNNFFNTFYLTLHFKH